MTDRTDTGVRSDIGPFVIVPAWLIDAVPDPGAILAWCTVATFADREGVCWPSRKRLAAMMRCSTDTVDRRLARLTEAGALEVQPRRTDEGDQDTNRYVLRYAAPERRGGRTDAPTGGRSDAATGSRAPAAQNYTQEELDPVGTTSRDRNLGGDLGDAEAAFAAWWDRYPRKVAKKAARKAYRRALSEGATPAALAEGLEAWLPYWQARDEPDYVPHPATWLNGGRWEDRPAIPTPDPAKAKRLDAIRLLDPADTPMREVGRGA